MNYNEFISILAKRVRKDKETTLSLSDKLIEGFCEHLQEKEELDVPELGRFYVEKKMEEVIVTPSTKQRLLVPPRLVSKFESDKE